ncbi:MAG: hypothetical protein ACI4MF_07245 [Candidatus Faecivicinus sp.]
MQISSKDRETLRELAKRQAELAASPRNQQLMREWIAFGSNDAPKRPMIRIEIDTFQHEILPALMRCEGAQARKIEARMLKPIANFTLFEDDTLVPAYYAVGDRLRFVPFGLPAKREETGGLGHHFIPYLHDLEEDEHLLGPSAFSVDDAGAAQELAEMEELFGDILPVRRLSDALISCPTQDIVHIMNMDDMYVAMIDDEERFHAMMRRLTDDYIAYFEMLESGKHLRSAARMQHLCQGTYCFTDELPDDAPGAPLKDLWLYMDSQETSGVSPAMFAELIFPYYRELMDRFGLVSYGCCEATHGIWDNCLSKVPNLRKVSISPWCDEEFMGERLQGTRVTYLRKPPATILGMDAPLDEDAARQCFRKTARAAKNCKLEIAQRDVYQVHHDPEKVRRYVQIAREEIER